MALMIVAGLGIGVGLGHAAVGPVPSSADAASRAGPAERRARARPPRRRRPAGHRCPAPGRAPRRGQRQEDPPPGRDRPARPRHHRDSQSRPSPQGRRLRRRAGTARPGAVGRPGGYRRPPRASRCPPSACSSSARPGWSAPSSICTRRPSGAVGTSAIRCPPTRRWCRWPWPAPWGGRAPSRSPPACRASDWAMTEIAQALLWAQAYRKQP